MRVVEVLEQGIADGSHIGAQLYVSRAGEVLADVAIGKAALGTAALGRARAERAMTTDTMMTWFSMTRP
jgi:hypothetical protein